LKTKTVEVEEFGEVEIRELKYSEAEVILEYEPGKIGKALIKACLYKDGERIFDDEVSFSVANKLFGLVDQVLEINGLGKPKGP